MWVLLELPSARETPQAVAHPLPAGVHRGGLRPLLVPTQRAQHIPGRLRGGGESVSPAAKVQTVNTYLSGRVNLGDGRRDNKVQQSSVCTDGVGWGAGRSD